MTGIEQERNMVGFTLLENSIVEIMDYEGRRGMRRGNETS